MNEKEEMQQILESIKSVRAFTPPYPKRVELRPEDEAKWRPFFTFMLEACQKRDAEIKGALL